MLAAGRALAGADGDGNLTQGNLTDGTLARALSDHEERSPSEAAIVGIVAACSTVVALVLLAAYHQFTRLQCNRLSRKDTVLQLEAPARSERQHDQNAGTELQPPPPPPPGEAVEPVDRRLFAVPRLTSLTNLRAHGLNGRVGLVNLGNTCFMNAALQCLSHTRWLADHFRGDEWCSMCRKRHLGRVCHCSRPRTPGPVSQQNRLPHPGGGAI